MNTVTNGKGRKAIIASLALLAALVLTLLAATANAEARTRPATAEGMRTEGRAPAT